MPKRLDHPRSDLRRATRALELRNRLRRATVVIADMEDPAAPPAHISFWMSYKHYFCVIVGALVGGASVFLMTVLLDGSRTANSKELAKMTSPMTIAVDRAIGQAGLLIKMLEGIVHERGSKPNLEATENPSEYQKCLEDCARGFRVMEESDKGLVVNCRNECISRYSKRVKEMRKRYFRDEDSD
ncbi:MAG: hypothetical protein ACLQPD_23460 [Desulfomonilaceae bacterium]